MYWVGAGVGLMVGVGLLLIWRSGPRRPRWQRVPGRAWLARRTDTLRQAGIEGVTGGQLLGIQAAAALLTGLVVLVATRSVAIAVCFAAWGGAAPIWVVRRYQSRRQRELRELWPDVVDSLVSAIRAGLSLPEAVSDLATRGPDQLRPAFAAFTRAYAASGRFSVALDELKERLADPVGDQVIEALRLASAVGGTDLGELLRTLSAFRRDDARTRAELETRQSWTINAARLAVAAPWLVLLLLATQTTTLTAYDSPPGLILLAIGGATCVVAYRLMLRIGQLPAEKRVLR